MFVLLGSANHSPLRISFHPFFPPPLWCRSGTHTHLIPDRRRLACKQSPSPRAFRSSFSRTLFFFFHRRGGEGLICLPACISPECGHRAHRDTLATISTISAAGRHFRRSRRQTPPRATHSSHVCAHPFRLFLLRPWSARPTHAEQTRNSRLPINNPSSRLSKPSEMASLK